LILRPFSPAAGDEARLAGFSCSTGEVHEDDVEQWIRTDALAWLDDVPKTLFQRRRLALIEEDDQLMAIVAWQDIVRVDLEGIWLEVLAVATPKQHGGHGQRSYDLINDHLRTVERNGDVVAGLVHVENARSKRLLTVKGWRSAALCDDNELWVGSL
jgi:hypothetical protein